MEYFALTPDRVRQHWQQRLIAIEDALCELEIDCVTMEAARSDANDAQVADALAKNQTDTASLLRQQSAVNAGLAKLDAGEAAPPSDAPEEA